MDDAHGITTGSQFLSPTGRIWTVRAVTPHGPRVELTSEGPAGERGAVMDVAAVLRMVRIDRPEVVADTDSDDHGAAAPLADLTRT